MKTSRRNVVRTAGWCIVVSGILMLGLEIYHWSASASSCFGTTTYSRKTCCSLTAKDGG